MLKISGNLTSTTAIGDAGEYVAPPASPITNIQGLFSDNEGGFWFDPSDATTIKKDSQLNQASYGDRVHKVLDKSGNGNDLIGRQQTIQNSDGDTVTRDMRPFYGTEPIVGRRNLIGHNQVVATSNNDGVKSFTGIPSTITIETSPAYAPQHTALGAGDAARFLVLENNNFNYSSVEMAATSFDDGMRAGTHTASFWVQEYTGGGSANSLYMIVHGHSFYYTYSTGAFTNINGSGTTHTATQHGDWHRISLTSTATNTSFSFACFGANNGDYGNAGEGNGFYFMGAQIETGTSATNFQKTFNEHHATEYQQTNIDYLFFKETENNLDTYSSGGNSDDVVDSTLLEKTTNVSLANIGEMTLFVALHTSKPNLINSSDRPNLLPAEGYETQTVIEFSDAAEQGVGFRLSADYNETANTTEFSYLSNGGITATCTTSDVGVDVTKLITCISDISNDTCKIEVNGTLADSVTGDQGTLDYGTQSLNVGADGIATPQNAFFGKIYQIVGRGAVTSNSDIENIETIVAAKAGLTV